MLHHIFGWILKEKKEFAELFPPLAKDSDYIHSVYREEEGYICLHADFPFGTERSLNSHQQLSAGPASSAHCSVTGHNLLLLWLHPAANGHGAKMPLLSTDYKINSNKHKIKASKLSCWTPALWDDCSSLAELLLSKPGASLGPHHTAPCIRLSWEAPLQKHWCAGFNAHSNRWAAWKSSYRLTKALLLHSDLCFPSYLLMKGHTLLLNKYMPANRHFIKGFLLIHCNLIQSIFCPRNQKVAHRPTHFLIPLCNKSWQHYSVLKRFQWEGISKSVWFPALAFKCLVVSQHIFLSLCGAFTSLPFFFSLQEGWDFFLSKEKRFLSSPSCCYILNDSSFLSWVSATLSPGQDKGAALQGPGS